MIITIRFVTKKKKTLFIIERFSLFEWFIEQNVDQIEYFAKNNCKI